MGGHGSPCLNCHTGGSPGQGDVDFDVCDTCHSAGGAYDGLNDPSFGALNNWENLGDPTEANQSLIYENGDLKSGKEKWCAGCHDSYSSGELVLAVDDFEGYASDSALRAVWVGRQDAKSTAERANPFLAPSAPPPQGSESMEVDVWWEKTTYTYGTVSRDYSPVLDLDAADTVGFWLRVESTSKFSNVKVKLRVLNDTDWSIGTVGFNAFDIEAWVWKWIQLSRADFTNNADWSTVNRIQFRANENSGTNYHVSFWIDDVKILTSGSVSDAPNVVGDDQTWGHYITGHRFSCTYCHDPDTAHIDGERRTSIYDYFTNYTNPTGFRFYSDSSMGLQLPYTSYAGGSEGAFALCYTCHDESVITQDEAAEDLITNFTDYGDIFGTSLDNLHLYHVGGPGSNMTPLVFHGTCVLCHDPHGQSNPAMTRTDMGDFIYFDTNGCEISLGADSDTDGTKDWYDPDVNMGGAQQETKGTGSYPMCTNVCHTEAAPPNPDCAGGNPYTGSGMDGWYERAYEYVPHAENMDVGPICLTAGCHPVGQLHAAHFVPDPGPDFPLNETGCYYCHVDGRLQCADAALFRNVDPEGPPHVLSDTAVCDSCHSASP
jgi:predicted CXXCH cytochrome family protein